MFYDGIYTGYRYQCVELARRYLIVNHGVTFESIPMAYDIFQLKFVKRVEDGSLVPMTSHENGSTVRPVKGSMLIWKPLGGFKVTGHVAIIVDVSDDGVSIVEQNVYDTVWPSGQQYSRRLPATVDRQTGGYSIQCTYSHEEEILGWTIVDLNSPYVPEKRFACTAHDLTIQYLKQNQCAGAAPWIDDNDPIDAVYKLGNNDVLLDAGGKVCTQYFKLTSDGLKGLQQATEELHKMFLNATEYVIHRKDLLTSEFKIPRKLIAKIRKSWFTRNRDTISGRFDFALTPTGVKTYEYNADSASCMYECGSVQDRWAEAVGIDDEGRDSGDELFRTVTERWIRAKVQGVLHLLYDSGNEEKYHTMCVQKCAEAAGIKCKIVEGIASLKWNDNGDIIDAEGLALKTVWKTWAWQTALNQVDSTELDLLYDEEHPTSHGKANPVVRDPTKRPLLVDVLMHDKIRVFEPLWTILPSCKAILPIMCQLYPNSPYLLKSSFTLSDEMKAGGYVCKPITGRGGGNVTVIDKSGQVVDKTPGKWTNDKDVYQELCPLPKYDSMSVQVCTFCVNGRYGGIVLRADNSTIINTDSSIYCLRINDDQ